MNDIGMDDAQKLAIWMIQHPEEFQMSQQEWEAIVKSREDKLLADFSNEIEKRDRLITELCDAVEDLDPGYDRIKNLVQRAREAVK